MCVCMILQVNVNTDGWCLVAFAVFVQFSFCLYIYGSLYAEYSMIIIVVLLLCKLVFVYRVKARYVSLYNFGVQYICVCLCIMEYSVEYTYVCVCVCV